MSTGRLLTGAALAFGIALLVLACGGAAAPTPDLALVSTRDGDYAIYTMSAAGGHQRRLTDERGDPSSPTGLFFQIEPAWSPDGSRIAFASKRTGIFKIFLMHTDGSGTRQLTFGSQNDTSPTWSPDGTQIAFVRGDHGELEAVRIDGTGLRRLAATEAAESDPAWSPGGGWLAYVRRTPGTSSHEVWLMRPDGSGRRPLTDLKAFSTAPTWSPDGKTIAFSSDTKTPDRFDIYLVRIDGTGFRRLTTAGGAFEPAWSPDGRTIAFERDGAILVIAVKGGQTTTLTEKKNNDSSPAWRPRSGGS